MSHDGSELHSIDPGRFDEDVRSFEHWFGAVQGYLDHLDHGRRADLDPPLLEAGERERLVAALCTYCVGEMAALEASSGLIAIAPNRASKIFLATQVVDEARHVEVLVHRLRELGVYDPDREIERCSASSVRTFKQKLLGLVAAGEWDAAIFAQNVMLEAMEFTVFSAHARVADPVTRDLLERILRDERRHIGFGENELGRRVRHQPARRLWISAVKSELDRLVLDTFEDAFQELRIPYADRPDLGHAYLEIVGRLGID